MGAPDEMGGAEEALLKVSEVALRCGVSADVLRKLLDRGALVGVRRGRGGHVYVPESQQPSYDEVARLVEEELSRAMRRAQSHLRRIAVEVEAVGNDLALAAEDPRAPLGNDLLGLNIMSTHSGSPLQAALQQLELASWDVRAWHEALREVTAVRSTHLT